MSEGGGASRADALLKKGDHAGQRIWKRNLVAVQELQRTERPASAREH